MADEGVDDGRERRFLDEQQRDRHQQAKRDTDAGRIRRSMNQRQRYGTAAYETAGFSAPLRICSMSLRLPGVANFAAGGRRS